MYLVMHKHALAAWLRLLEVNVIQQGHVSFIDSCLISDIGVR